MLSFTQNGACLLSALLFQWLFVCQAKNSSNGVCDENNVRVLAALRWTFDAAAGESHETQGRFCIRSLSTLRPMIFPISSSVNPSAMSASVICTSPLVSNGVLTAPSKSEPSPT